jgi:hypothetical protein
MHITDITTSTSIKRVLVNSLALGSVFGLVAAVAIGSYSATSVDVMASGNPFGTSIRFYGTGTNYNDRVEIPIQGNKLNIGATDFTIEFWMKVPTGVINTPVGGGNGWIWGNIILDRDIYGNYPNDFGLSLFNGNLRFGTGPNPDTNTIETSGVNVADGQWHHVAIVRVASSGQVRIYVDGTQRASGNLQAGDISYSGSHSGYINGPCNENKDPYLVLGAEKHDYFWCAENDATKAKNNAYNGLLDDLRISNIARYNANFTRPNLPHPIDSHTIALYRFDDENADDSASNPVNGVVKTGVSFTNGVVDDSCTPFNDVPTNHDFYFYICYLRNAGVVSGYPGNLYKPQNLVNRGEMAKFIYIGANVLEDTSCGNFPDVPNGAPFYQEITSLKCAGIVSGYPQSGGPNIYKPNNNVSRGEMAKFVKNAFNIPTNTTCGDFPDVPNGAPFYQEITSLKCAGIVSGYPQSGGPNIYKPNNNVSRGEMAKFVTLAMLFWYGM